MSGTASSHLLREPIGGTLQSGSEGERQGRHTRYSGVRPRERERKGAQANWNPVDMISRVEYFQDRIISLSGVFLFLFLLLKCFLMLLSFFDAGFTVLITVVVL